MNISIDNFQEEVIQSPSKKLSKVLHLAIEFEVRGAWCVVRGAWCVVRGAWCVVRGVLWVCVAFRCLKVTYIEFEL